MTPLTITLGDLRRGDKGIVTHIEAANASGSGLTAEELKRRLFEAGLVEGTTVRLVHEGPFGGDPIAVEVNDSRIALRRGEAKAVCLKTA